MSDSTFTVRRFSDDFARILRERILSGELKPGERLNEVKLAATYGISRSPIREALQALSGEGLVAFVAGKGAFVGGLSATEVSELGQVREALETHAARLVATHGTPEQIADLATRIGVSEGGPGDAEGFHAALLRLSGNTRLAQLGLSVAAQLRLSRSHSATRPGRIEEAAAEHAVIVEAIRRGDADAAESATRAHIVSATRSALTMVTEG